MSEKKNGSAGSAKATKAKKPASMDVNTDLSNWDKQFRQAIKAGAQPETDLFEGVENEFDQREWR